MAVLRNASDNAVILQDQKTALADRLDAELAEAKEALKWVFNQTSGGGPISDKLREEIKILLSDKGIVK